MATSASVRKQPGFSHPAGCRVLFGLLAAVQWQSVTALEALSETELSSVSGRDGVTLNLQSSSTNLSKGIEAAQIAWTTDAGSADENTLTIDQFQLVPVGPLGSTPSTPLDMTVAIDAFTHSVSGNTSLALDLFWQRMRVSAAGLHLSDEPSASIGQFALDTPGRIRLLADGGIFNASGDNASLLLNFGGVNASDPLPTNWSVDDPAQFYYRHGAAGSPELALANLGFLLDMPKGIVGIDGDGLLAKSSPGSVVDFNLTFDLHYDGSGVSPFAITAADRSLLHFGWRGGWENFLFQLGGKGAWPGGIHNQGVTASLGFDFADDYRVIIGEASGNRPYLELSQPQRLPGSGLGSTAYTGKDYQLGYLTLDALHASRGPGGICFGANTGGFGQDGASGCASAAGSPLPAQLINLVAEDNALAILARDWRLRGYSSKVVYRDDVSGDVVDENWALIYTLGDLDANIYAYPKVGGGLTLDAVLAVQTFGETEQERWENGTHFMIGDTDNNLAIGLVGADLLFAAKAISLNMNSAGISLDSPQARVQLRGMLGGGDIPDMAVPQSMAYIDFNLESDRLRFSLEPAPAGENYLGYSGFVSLTNLDENSFSNQDGGAHGGDDGSYISLAEPSFDRLDVDFRLADIQGDIEIDNGRVNLLTSAETDHGRPELRISNTLKLGQAATIPEGGSGDIFQVGRVEFGDRDLGRLVIPAGQINASLILKEQR